MRFGPDFEALVSRFSSGSHDPIAIAISGGSDSVVLLYLAQEWARRTQHRILALTVDHRLRPEAAQEGKWVAALCGRLGVTHQTLAWHDPKPTQKAARSARYELLARAARRANAKLLLVGHTRDDVVETALIRRRRDVRDTSAAGPVLAAPAPVWPAGRGVTVLRPLLQQRRAALRTYLQVAGQDWIEDPSNESIAFERIRIRKFLDRSPHLKRRAAAYVDQLQERRFADDFQLGDWLSQCHVGSDGLIQSAPVPAPMRGLAVLARLASGSDRDPRADALGGMRRLLQCPGQRQTLGGAWFQKTGSGYLIGRDPGARQARLEAGLFDGRFEPAAAAMLPRRDDQAFLVRHAAPDGANWKEVISERLQQLVQCYQTPRLSPVQT
ncbi:MAG: tRNA lysidine(34) synthetase TilS [Pseudomonadota bacterium]